MVSTGPVPKHQPEESQQQPCSYQENFIKSEGKEVGVEIFFINLDNIDLVFFLFVVFIDKEEEVE